MSENEIQEDAAETATDTKSEATEEVKTDEKAAPAETITVTPIVAADEVKAEAPAEAATEEIKSEVPAEAAESTEPATEAAPEPVEPEEPEEISYHAVEKEGEITAIWEMQGRKHLRTISARSSEGTKILSLFTSEIHETDSPSMGSAAANEKSA